MVTINSDDPAYFGGYINDNFIAIHHALGLKKEIVEKLCRNSFQSAFIGQEQKIRYLQEVQEFSQK